MTFLVEEGVQGKSVVDLGCGAGGFAIQLLKEGASIAAGFDLSQKMIDTANELAKVEGFETKTKFQVGNAADAELPSSHIVIMDKVLCCYSDWQLLLKNAINTSQETIGFIVPRDVGIAKLCFRPGVKIVNYFAKRKGNTLFYLHPLREVDKTLQESGFTLTKKQTKRFWLAFLYNRKLSSAQSINHRELSRERDAILHCRTRKFLQVMEAGRGRSSLGG